MVEHAKVDVVQNWMDPFHQDKEVRALCAEHGIQYMAYSSLGTQWNRNPNPVLSSRVLRRIALKHGASVAQVVIAWVIAEGAIALPRSSSEQHLKENFAGYVNSKNVQNEMQESGNGNMAVQLDAVDLAEIIRMDGILGEQWDSKQSNNDSEDSDL